VNLNGTVQFTASIQNLSSTLVNWQVNSTQSGNSTYGTINTNGLYTAPANLPTNNVVTITAVAQTQTSLTASATLTILPAAAISGVSCKNPLTELPSQTVASGASLLCTPTVEGGGNVAVYWYVNNSPTCSSTLGVLGGNSTVGIITGVQQGNYVGPQIPPPGAAVAITAVSQIDSTQAFCLPVTLTFADASLQGSYAFSTSGRVIAGNSFFARAGSFTANGTGGLIGALEDINESSGATEATPSFTGTYTIGGDGRGTMQFCEHTTVACSSSATTSYFRIVVLSATQAKIIEFSSPTSTGALTTGSGEIDQQPNTTFGTDNLSGTYTFDFSGVSSAGNPESAVGEFVAGGNNTITSGELDINNNGTLSQLQILNTSTYSISANGRGSATLVLSSGSPLNFSVYIVSASRAKFIETDSAPASMLAGDAVEQQTIAPWAANALTGSIVFATRGSGPSGGIADLVSFTSDGKGNVVAGGMLDQNSGGTVTSVSSLGAGSYTFDLPGTTGRGTLSIPGHSYVFYMVAPGTAVIQETTSGVVAHGSLVQPQGGPFTLASLRVSYALSLTGTNAAGKEEDFVGQLTSNGAGTVTSGSLDTNSFGTSNFGTTQTGVTEVGTYLPVPAGTLRATMPLTTVNFVLYFVSPTQVFALDTDATDIAVGSLYEQF